MASEETRKYQAAWRKKNREKINERRRELNANNKERLKKYFAEYYLANKEKKNAQSKKWRDENKEKCYLSATARRKANPKKENERISAWRKLHPEKFRNIQKKYRDSHKDKLKESNAAWMKAHPEYRRLNESARRAAKKNGSGTLSKDIIQILWKRQKGKCAVCKADLKETGFHLDHIVPLIPRKGEPAGKHEDANMQLTCPKCNRKKHNKNPIQFMREQGYLL